MTVATNLVSEPLCFQIPFIKIKGVVFLITMSFMLRIGAGYRIFFFFFFFEILNCKHFFYLYVEPSRHAKENTLNKSY